MSDIEKLEEQLLRLTDQHYEEVRRSGYYKDRDCHFFINKVWSYGDKPYWRIEHYGYHTDLDDYCDYQDKEYNSYEKALKDLVSVMTTIVADLREKEWVDSWDV